MTMRNQYKAEMNRMSGELLRARLKVERLTTALNNRDGTLRAIVEKTENAHPNDFGMIIATVNQYAIDALSDFPQEQEPEK